MKRLLALLLVLAMLACPVFTAFAEGAEGEFEDEVELWDEPPEELEPIEGAAGAEPGEEIPVMLPSIAPTEDPGANPDTGDPPLMAAAIAAGAAALAVLVVAVRKPKKS